MTVFGVRCSNSDYTYCLLEGTKTKPVLRDVKRTPYPDGYSECELLKWLHQEMADLFGKYACGAVGIKKAEGNVKRSNALEARLQAEAIVALAAAQAGCLSVKRKMGMTIAKDLGLKGKAKYLQTELDTSVINGFDGLADKAKDSVLAAWSCL